MLLNMSCLRSDEDVIDLTDSFTMSVPRNLPLVINLDIDDSIIDLNSSIEKSFEIETVPKKKNVNKKITRKNNDDAKCSSEFDKTHLAKFGDCPICWEELGKNPLASTKCGHVFCLKCLERSLKFKNICPTCRKLLPANSSSYHPLYL